MATGSYEGFPADGRQPGSPRGVSVTRGAHGWSSALSHIFRPAHQRPKAKDAAMMQPSRRRGRRRMKVGARQGCQRLDRISAVGRKRPRSRDCREVSREVPCCIAIRRSGLKRRETLDSPSHAVWSLRLRGASPPRKWRARAGNTRGVGTRSSFGWQISVGRIARLSRRQLARAGGDSKGASQEEVRSSV